MIIKDISIINNNDHSFKLVSGYANTKINGTKLVCEDSNSNNSSGVSSEEACHHQLNLDLSIGLPSSHPQVNDEKLKLQQLQGDEQQETKVTANHGLCLCYGLGFQSNQVCYCNKAIGNTVATNVTDNNMYRFYRPMNI
jgi:transcription factor MYB, plant